MAVLVGVALAVAVAAAAAALVAVLVALAMAVARSARGLLELTSEEGGDDGVAVALGARVDVDAGLRERVDGAAADAAADEHVDAAGSEHAGKGAMTRAIGAHDLGGNDLAVLDVVDLELLGATEVLEDVAVVVRDRDSHSALLLCRPRLGVGLRSGGIGDVAAGDDQAPAVDQRVGDLCTGAVADGRHRGAGDAHALGGLGLAQMLEVHEAQRLKLVDR